MSDQDKWGESSIFWVEKLYLKPAYAKFFSRRACRQGSSGRKKKDEIDKSRNCW
jgi:hypothetical protein